MGGLLLYSMIHFIQNQQYSIDALLLADSNNRESYFAYNRNIKTTPQYSLAVGQLLGLIKEGGVLPL